MSPVSGGITLKLSHAYRPRRAFLNQWTGPERPFQHTLRQGHLTEIQVGGRATRRGAARRRWGVGVACECPLHYTLWKCALSSSLYSHVHLSIRICVPRLWRKHIYCTIRCHIYWVDLFGKVSRFRCVIRTEYTPVKAMLYMQNGPRVHRSEEFCSRPRCRFWYQLVDPITAPAPHSLTGLNETHAWVRFSDLSNNLHKKKNVSTYQTRVCARVVCQCVRGSTCVSVHQTGEEKNNPIIETVCLTDIQYVHG